MNILFFYESMMLGGQQTYTYNIVKRMSRNGHQIHHAYLYGDAMQEKMLAYAQLHHISTIIKGKDYIKAPWKLIVIMRQIRKICRQNQIDVVISGSGIGSFICGWATRYSATCHYRLVGCSLSQVEKTLYKYYRHCMIDRVIDGYFGWPAVFDELAEKNVDRNKCFITPDVVDTEDFFPLEVDEKRELRNKLNITEDTFVIGWIGRIATGMQVGNTVKLGRLLLERGLSNFKLLLVGGGPWFEGIKDVIADYGLVEHVILTDWVPMDEVNNYINCMDVVPLLEEDPQGGSIVRESIACGVVTISVDGKTHTQKSFMKPDFSYLVEPSNFLEDAADIVTKLINEPQLVKEKGSKARKYAIEQMSFDNAVNIMLNAIAVK